jgi:hypothetical protein
LSRAAPRALLLAALAAAAAACAPAQRAAPAPVAEQAPAAAQTPRTPAPGGELHAPFTRLLERVVSDGRVDYAELARREPELQAYLADLAAVDTAALDRRAALAFWVNAYNAFTLELVVERTPGLRSIMEIPANERWTDERWEAGGRRWSLRGIERDALRPLGDPRIHAALVRASRSCPDLAAEAYVPERLDAQLDAAVRGFLADRFKGLSWGAGGDGLFDADDVLRLSRVFDWYGEDFAAQGPLVDFVLRYAPAEAVAFARAHREELGVEYLEWDWSLNGR